MALEQKQLVANGELIGRSEITQITEKFRKQEFYLDCSTFDTYTGEKRDNILKFQVANANIEKLSVIPDKSRIKVAFRVSGRFYEKTDGTGKAHFQNLEAYAFEIVGNSQATPTPPPTPTPTAQPQPQPPQRYDDDLPF